MTIKAKIKNTIEATIEAILIIFVVYIFVWWIFPSLCKIGMTGLCGI